METVWQLALTLARRKTVQREVAINAQMEEMKKKQIEMEAIMQQLISEQGNQINNSMGDDVDDDDHLDEAMNDDVDWFLLLLFYF